MDDLLRYCMRELAFDGDLGCDVSRLRHFVEAFYSSPNFSGKQTVDDSLHTFVWSLLVKQPSVRVGLVAQGSAVEVYIAPQLSKKKKETKLKDKKMASEASPCLDREDQDVGASDENPIPGHLQLIDGASASSLNSLNQQYGSGLRLAVDPETSFRAITGSHTRPAKLSPMVYTALQLISRGREGGLSVIDLGKKTGYDQKTCFYLIKQLCELDLVVKLSKGGPGGGNFCVHKYFFTTSTFWVGVRREGVVGEDIEDPEHGGQNGDEDFADTRRILQFDPIDSRHLASIQLIKSRLFRLLKHSENGLHVYQNLLLALGFANPTKRDRRFFIVRIRELIKEGFIEKVVVPRVHGFPKTLCVRLVEDGRTSDTDGAIVQPVDVGDDEQDVNLSDDKEVDMPVVNLTIHRQILKLLEEAGHDGLTLNDISVRLGKFDKRTAELLVSRLERSPPPPHLADLATCDFLEHQGRERRHRYYTLPGYLSFIHRENIDHAGRTAQYTSRDFCHSGEFYSLSEDLFCKDQASLVAYEDSYRDKTKPPKVGGTRKIGRPRKDGTSSKPKNAMEDNGDAPTLKPRRKRTKATTELTDVKDGSESQETSQKATQRGKKRKRNPDEQVEDDAPPPQKKRGGRPLKKAAAQPELVSEKANMDSPVAPAPPLKRKRGRPPKMVKTSSLNRTGSGEATGGTTLMDPVEQTRSSMLTTEANDDTQAVLVTNKPAINSDTPATSLATERPVASLHDTVTEGDGNSRLHSVTGSTEISQQSGPRLALNSPIGLKRAHDIIKDGITDRETPPLKRVKSGRTRQHALVNISQMRAENEFMRVVEASGGITNISSKEFLDTHAHVIAKMVDAGESTSMAVGTQPDRRTIRKIFEKLEERGRLKTLTVVVAPRVGQPRPVKLAYEPGVTQERLDQFLAALREDVPVPSVPTHKMLERPIDYTRPKHHHARDSLLTQDKLLELGNEVNWRHSLNISDLDDDTVRSTILSEVQTVAQLYGYLVGRARRARELHQFTLSHFHAMNHSSFVVSGAERIIAFPYYYNDLPVSTYFAVISATEYNNELSALMETFQGRQTLVKDLPSDLYDKLKIGRARARDKIFGLLIILASLKLVAPLRPSTSEAPFLSCEPNNDYPTSFDLTSIHETRYNTSSPLYWRFNTIAPIYLYSMPEPWPPSFHRDMFTRTADESMPFWFELEGASLNKENMHPETSMDSITGPCACTLEVARTLRRRGSWVSSYNLSWSQKQYLYRWMDPSTSYTPLSDADGGRGCLEHICHVISAPVDAVCQFFTASHSMFMKEKKRIGVREQRRKAERDEKKTTKDRALLAKKAAEARRQLEADWDALVLRVHPEPMPRGSGTRLKQLRMRYLQSRATMDNQKWEATILEAITDSRSGKRNPTLFNIASSVPHKASRWVGMPHLSPVTTYQQRSVTDLIERQKERVAAFQAISQGKRSKNEASVAGSDVAPTISIDTPRRQRFQWTSEYDELARDASAIIKSRCRTWHRMDWTALDQLFPFLPRNNVRQRISTLRQEAGGESYLRLLEDKWHDLWTEHRGTVALPDDNPTHPSEFDAIVHVEFLRRYIDKRALRVGLPNADMQNAAGAVLAEKIPEFFSKWTVNEKPRVFNKMDVVWTAVGDEHREKAFLGEAFSRAQDTFTLSNASKSLSNGVAESGLKMALATPEEDYDPDNATLFLNGIGQEAVRQATETLVKHGVITESGKAHRKKPGRKLKISSLNEDALSGSFHSDFYAEACGIEDMFDNDLGDWRDWSEIASDGEMAALIELVSARKIEFQIDVTGPASQRQQLDWNSKKVDDDQIATALAVRFHPPILDDVALSDSPPQSPAPMGVPMDVEDVTSMEHGQSFGEPAPCRRTSQGVITCSACLSAEQDTFLTNLDLESRNVSSELMERLETAGKSGLRRDALLMYPSQSQCLCAAIDRLASGNDPQCYWVGYADPVLVSRHHIREWTVSIPGLSTPRLVFPRRWLDIKGEVMDDVWNAGLRAVVGVLVVRPGIPQTELRQRLISVYDRQEINDLLHHLCVEGLITKKVSDGDTGLQFKDLRAMDVIEERKTCWTLAWNAWYRTNINE